MSLFFFFGLFFPRPSTCLGCIQSLDKRHDGDEMEEEEDELCMHIDQASIILESPLRE